MHCYRKIDFFYQEDEKCSVSAAFSQIVCLAEIVNSCEGWRVMRVLCER